MRRILLLAIHPMEAASTRHRLLAYRPWLETAGFEVTVDSFFSSEGLTLLSQPGRRAARLRLLLHGASRRWHLLARGRYDGILVHREVFPLGMRLGTRLLCARLRGLGCRVAYDFDDAMYLPQRQDRGMLRWLEGPGSTRDLIHASDLVIAGNEVLAEYARRLHAWVEVLPTPVDTTCFAPRELAAEPSGIPVVGWIGSSTTSKYLGVLGPVCRAVGERYRFCVKIVGGGRSMALDGVPVDWRDWELDREAEEFRTCDIGVYPLWDDPWARGKCGFKALQFMASGVPVIASAIGINREIIQDGVNGFLASGEEEWVSKLTQLLGDPGLRRRMGAAGRATVESRYALDRLADRFVELMRRLTDGREGRRPDQVTPGAPEGAVRQPVPLEQG